MSSDVTMVRRNALKVFGAGLVTNLLLGTMEQTHAASPAGGIGPATTSFQGRLHAVTPSPSVDTSSQPPGVPIRIGVIVVLGYLLLHMIHGRMFYGAYVFAIERIVFLAFTLPCLMLALRIPLRDLIGTFQLPKRKDFRFFLVSLALVVVSCMTLQISADWIAPGAHSAVLELSMRRLLDNCVVAPLTEEPVFRALVLLCLLPMFDRQRWQLLILSALIFTACHTTPSYLNLIATTIGGAIYAAFFLRTRSLSGSIILHAVWNAVTFIHLQNL